MLFCLLLSYLILNRTVSLAKQTFQDITGNKRSYYTEVGWFLRRMGSGFCLIIIEVDTLTVSRLLVELIHPYFGFLAVYALASY